MRRARGFVAGLGLLLVSFRWASACSFPDYRFGNGGAGGDAGSGGTSGGEECGNGKDDDGDGAKDCDDEDCRSSGWRCVKSFGGDWHGPVAFWSGSTDETPPSCAKSGGYSIATYESLVFEPSVEGLSCPTCECSGAVLEVTKSVSFRLEYPGIGACAFSDPALCDIQLHEGCNSVVFDKASLTNQGPPSRCNVVDCPYLIMTPLKVRVAGGRKEVVPVGTKGVGPTHSSVAVLCELPKKDLTCADADLACAKRPSEPFLQEICIYTESADATCPVGWTIKKPTLYRAFTDQRDCSTCTCPCTWSKDTGLARFEDHGRGGCSDNIVAVSIDNNRSGAAAYLDTTEKTEERYFSATIAPSGEVSCAASTSVTVGQVVGESPITVCCTGS
jgi:hypothetical protein